MNHGHVTPNPDGSTARCGGPGLCSECSIELAQKNAGATIPIKEETNKLNHPCKETCSGWQQGFEAGKEACAKGESVQALVDSIKDFIASQAKEDGGFACTYCDMGGAGYSSKGDGHHDDIRDVCPVVKLQYALETWDRANAKS